MASRYDVTTACLCRHLLNEKNFDGGRVERLDHRADPELAGLLAAGARIAPARLRAMRVAAADGTASCWFRQDAAWCPECVRKDLAQGPEVHERATWRLGCSVMCPDHGVLLQDACVQCWHRPRCWFRHAQGWLGLACSVCGRSPYKPNQPAGGLEFGSTGAFDIQVTPRRAALVKDMQRDLQAALLGGAPTGSWGAVRSGRLLLRVVRDFAFSIVLAKGIKVEQRSELVMGRGRVPYVTVLYEPVTPAALSPRAAFGVLAIAGAVLASMAPNAGAGHTWRPDGDLHPIDARWFMEWLGDRARTWLCSSAHHWDHPVGAAFGAATSASSAVATT